MLDKKSCYLELSVLYLTDRYHGKEDWPPSPVRVFQALTAAARKGLSPSEWHDSASMALKWLEEKPAPFILAPEPAGLGAFVITGPRNQADKAVKPMGIDVKRMRKQRDLKPLSSVFLPDALENRFVKYLWPISKTDVESHRKEIESICRIARKMTHLGYGIDQVAGSGRMIQGDSVQYEGVKLYAPGERPTLLRFKVPTGGYLENLIDLYEKRHGRLASGVVFPYSHPEKYRLVYYRKEGELSMERPVSIFALKSPDGSGRTVSVRWQDAAMTVAPWARHAAGGIMKQEGRPRKWIDQFVLGHTSDGAKDQRLSYLPLPSIGHQHVDGRIRRFAIAEPVGFNGEITEMIEWSLPYRDLVNIDGENVAKPEIIRPGRDRMVMRYLGKAKKWTTVTPMIMHGQVYQRRKFSPRKLEKLLLSAFLDAGYPEDVIEDFDFKRAPYWDGCGDARLMRVPKHLNRWPRYHISVTFKVEMTGPIVAGIGRHYGLGLFARVALSHRESSLLQPKGHV